MQQLLQRHSLHKRPSFQSSAVPQGRIVQAPGRFVEVHLPGRGGGQDRDAGAVPGLGEASSGGGSCSGSVGSR